MKGDLGEPLSNFPNIAAILEWFTLREWFGFKIPFVYAFRLMCSFSRKKLQVMMVQRFVIMHF